VINVLKVNALELMMEKNAKIHMIVIMEKLAEKKEMKISV